MCCIAILIGFYWYADNLPNSIGFVRDGVTAGVSAIIGGLALEAILKVKPEINVDCWNKKQSLRIILMDALSDGFKKFIF